MNDWYSSYLLSRDRQREVIRQAEGRRKLEAARVDRGARGSGRFGSSKILQRIGEVQVSLGHAPD